MGPFFIVTLQPFRTDLAHLLQRLKYIGTQYFGPIHPVIAFDQGILIGLARLDVPELNRSFGTSCHEPLRDKFWPIVEANGLRTASPAHHLLQHANDALCRERRINLDRQALPHAFIQNIEGAESTPAIQGVTHEIHRPHHIGLRHHGQRLIEPDRETLLGPAGEIQPGHTVDPPDPLMIPPLAVESQAITTFPEAPSDSSPPRVW